MTRAAPGGVVQGVAAMLLACAIWGLSPLFYALIAHVPATEVMAHRVFWSFVFFGLLLGGQGRLGQMVQALRRPALLRVLALGAATISVNWFLFIYSIQIGRTTEASLGYYIYPLVAVLLGRFVFSEALDRLQWLAVVLATLAVVVLTSGQGVAPWISLVLALSFGLYGILKKNLALGPVLSVSCEIAIVSPLALGYILWCQYGGGGGALAADRWRDAVVLILSGPVTAVPLILFSLAARRITMGAVGVLQYVNPTLQFLVAVLVFLEPFGPVHAAAFALIWTAVALYCVSAVRRDRSARNARSAASGVSTTVR